MSTFGEVLKKIRKENGDSLRTLGEKLDIVFTYVDKIEKGISPINKNILEKLIKTYPLRKSELMKAYLKEVVPQDDTTYIREIFEKKEKVDEIYEILLSRLSKEEKKDFLNNLVEKIELKSLKNGNYDTDKGQIELVKRLIENL
ncbi:helix-turn-helix transcriptional regulator [Fusobacterium varium]|uniref:helix-turn-helix domain-containing protein n=1 Tax=Fusobacterium varium TaxID=856 RepID=UPI0030D6069B